MNVCPLGQQQAQAQEGQEERSEAGLLGKHGG